MSVDPQYLKLSHYHRKKRFPKSQKKARPYDLKQNKRGKKERPNKLTLKHGTH